MGLNWLARFFGFASTSKAPVTSLAQATAQVAEVFTENKTRKMELGAEAQSAALAQFAAEFAHERKGWFDRLVDGLNRLPRPLMALGTLFLFAFAWIDPEQFTVQMQALQTVPEPLWWLLGAIVSFYFGARETHYLRKAKTAVSAPVLQAVTAREPKDTSTAPKPEPEPVQSVVGENAALNDWINSQDRKSKTTPEGNAP